ncbi:MAG: carbon-nitrogen family hydrolase [Lachnospiraceae bacterium]|nr:carbon-nitrogen family hydrolase [Lachnospiraceae bacterium]
MRTAIAEMHIEWEDKERNTDKLLHILDDIKDENVQLLLCPEMTFTGFSMNTAKTSETDFETVNKMKELSREYKIAIGFGWVKNPNDESGLCENHYTITSEHGELLLDYTKLHPFSYSGEDKYFKGGDDVMVCSLGEFNVGATICYDLRFPEIYQIISNVAGLIAVPANWPAKRSDAWSALLKARAIENQCYIAGINCRGSIDGIDYSGNSAVFSPEGEELCPVARFLTSDDDLVMIYDIKNNIENIRENFPVKKDRRTDLYKNIVLNKS